MSGLHALDSSAAVPLIAAYHDDHDEVIRWASRRRVALAGHAVAETYSVLTRLPRPVRLKPEDAARVLASGFAPALLLKPATARRLPEILAARRNRRGRGLRRARRTRRDGERVHAGHARRASPRDV